MNSFILFAFEDDLLLKILNMFQLLTEGKNMQNYAFKYVTKSYSFRRDMDIFFWR